MTEDEAKSKWRPMVRLTAGSAGSRAPNPWSPPANRIIDVDSKKAALNPLDARCIASECMMWRWGHEEEGWCGLAGKPAT